MFMNDMFGIEMKNFSIQETVQAYGQSLYAFLQQKKQTLFSSGLSSLAEAKNEIYYLLSFVLKKEKVFLFSHAEYVLTKTEQESFLQCFERRKKGEPLSYITGQKEFYGNNFLVDNSTLIPRPDTEILVDEVLHHYQQLEKNSSFQIMDLGTGTGCILLSVLMECERSFGYGIDINGQAIKLAEQNARELGLADRSHFFTADFTCPLFPAQARHTILHTEQLDCLVSNPPYIPDFEYNVLDVSVRQYEPETALVSGQAQNGEQGLAHAEKIVQLGEELLKSGGLLLIEHGYNQAKALQKLCACYSFAAIKTCFDLAGNERALYAIKK